MDVVVRVILDNLTGFTFDTIIILIGVMNGLIFIFTRSNTKKVSESLNVSLNMSLPIFTPLDLSPKELQQLDKQCKATEKLYSLYVGITSIFPFLGILGTVFSLIMLAGGDLSNAVQESFFVALTSTFWGVLFAIIYRFLDATVSTKIQSNSDEVTRLKHREEEKQRKKIAGEDPE